MILTSSDAPIIAVGIGLDPQCDGHHEPLLVKDRSPTTGLFLVQEFYLIVALEYFGVLGGLQSWEIEGIHPGVLVEQQPLHQCAESHNIRSPYEFSRWRDRSNGYVINPGVVPPRVELPSYFSALSFGLTNKLPNGRVIVARRIRRYLRDRR
jgi:hypothetical protein